MGEDGPGAGFFPLWYGGAMGVLSLVLVASAIVRKSPPKQPFQWHDLGRALLCWVAFVACIALMPLAGFTVSFALLTWFIVAVMASQPQRIAIPVAVVGAAAFYALFALALDLALPKGMLF
jgi:putative tricarboxylic transport membrane protein